jgi:hypothetical protein
MKCRFAVVAAAAVAVLGLACTSRAYEYHLEFTPPTPTVGGTVYSRIITIAEQFNSDRTVSGSISYQQKQCGVRICGPVTTHYLSGIWDTLGNLISTTPVQWPAQSPLYVTGTEEVYAVNGPATTSFDTARGGFLSYPASHYTWTGGATNLFAPFGPGVSSLAADRGYIVVPYRPPTTFQVELLSDGDLPLNITSTISQVIVSGYGTQGIGTVTSITGDCLTAPLAPGATCTLSMTFDPSTITAPASTGYAYNVLTLARASDAGNLPDWSTHFTVTGVPVPDDGD